MSKSEAPAPSLAEHPRRDDLAGLVRTLALSAADERSGRLGDGLEELMGEVGLSIEDGRIATVNVLEALLRVAELGEQAELSEAEREQLTRLLAAGIALTPPEDEAQADRLAAQLCWLAAHTFIDVGWLLDDALGVDAERLWTALGNLVRSADGHGARRGRAEALVALAALRGSDASAARGGLRVLGEQLRDPALRRLAVMAQPLSVEAVAAASQQGAGLPPAEDEGQDGEATLPRHAGSDAPASGEPRLVGELVAAPLGPFLFALGALSGVLLLLWLLRLIARVVLRSRRPASLTVRAAGITIDSSWDLLGRKLGQRQTHIPFINLARAAREVRYPRLAVYVGLIALALGTFLGVSLFTDGSRAASPSLLAFAAAVFGLGVLFDLLLSRVVPARQGKHRLLFVPRRGPAVALSTDDAVAADAALRALSTRTAP